MYLLATINSVWYQGHIAGEEDAYTRMINLAGRTKCSLDRWRLIPWNGRNTIFQRFLMQQMSFIIGICDLVDLVTSSKKDTSNLL